MRKEITAVLILFLSLIFFIFIRPLFAQVPDTLIQHLISQTSLDTLTHYVRILSGEDSVTISGNRYLITSRYWQNPNNDVAANFIYETLANFGVPTFNQNYSATGRNVYAVQTGTVFPDQQFIICAHYDDMPSFGLAPGADDNASGTAAVLEAARILTRIPTPYTVIYALWDEEEIGLVGSGYYAQQAAAGGSQILGVVNLEMFGWDGNDDGLYEIHTRSIANSVHLANLISHVGSLYQIGVRPDIRNPGTTASDHSSFWYYGYTALVFSQAFFGGDSNPFYHTSNDRIIHFNLGYFFSLSRLAVATISYLALNSTIVNIGLPEEPIASHYLLEQNYPNPFNPITHIEFLLPENCYAELTVYNSLGEMITTMAAENFIAGRYTYQWDGRNQPSGIYFYRLTAGETTQTRKMILVR